jgi:hypothetical protein
MATTNGINYNQTRGLILSTNGKNRVIVSTGGTTTFTGDTNASTVISVSGTNGGLFSVVDTNTGTLLEVLDTSNNPIFQVGTTDKIKMVGLSSATDPNFLTIDNSGIVHTIATSSFATTSQIQLDDVRGYQALGSVIKGSPIGLTLNRLNTSLTLTSGRLQLTAVFIPVETTVTGVRFYQTLIGTFTANNENRVGLYSYNSSTGAATLVASTADNANIWKATTNTWTSAAFSTPVTIQPGDYYIAMLYNAAGGATAPQIGAATGYVNGITPFDFPNSGKLTCHIVTQNTLPSSWSGSSTVSNPVNVWINLY